MGVTQRQKTKILDALAAMGEGYHTRDEIAAFLGKKTLQPKESYAVSALHEAGILESIEMPSKREHMRRIGYRIRPVAAGVTPKESESEGGN